jgi:CBS domain-containing protein/sporulation protein YlmC with PRC-barrel domain
VVGLRGFAGWFQPVRCADETLWTRGCTRIDMQAFIGVHEKEAEMCYFSEILGKPVEDAHGNHIGLLADLVVMVRRETPYPILRAIILEQQDKTILVPYINGTLTNSPTIPVKLSNTNQDQYIRGDNDLDLAQDLLDKILIDSAGVCTAQVSDLKLENLDGNQVVKNIDVGNLGILRRCGLVKTAQSIANHLGFTIKEHLIPWEAVQLEPDRRALRLMAPMDPVFAKYNARLAKILPGLNRYQRKQFLEHLDDTRLAEIFIQVEPDVQTSTALNLTDERLSKVIMEMGPDEAVSLLARIPRNRQENVLGKVDAEIARVLHKLLNYPHNSAGRIMSTTFRSVQANLTAAQAMSCLRMVNDGVDAGEPVYITDMNNRLTGITTVSDLAMANSLMPVESLMSKKVTSVHALDRVEDITPLFFRYNLRAVPVVDEDHTLRGIVLAKDVLNKNTPATWKKRQPKKYVHPILS